jgi:hypothetical protein
MYTHRCIINKLKNKNELILHKKKLLKDFNINEEC